MSKPEHVILDLNDHSLMSDIRGFMEDDGAMLEFTAMLRSHALNKDLMCLVCMAPADRCFHAKNR